MPMALAETPQDAARRRAKGTAHLVERKKKLMSGEIVSTKTVDQLSPSQRAFIKYVAEGDSGTTAAIRAGVKETSARAVASQWRSLPVVREQIAIAQRQYAESVQMTKKRVMEMHQEAFDMAKLMSEPATMVSAAREIGKLCGYYEPKKLEVNLSVDGAVQLEKMNKLTDAQLLEIINKGAQTLLEDIQDGDDQETDS